MQTTSFRHDTKAWKMQVWVSFFAAAFLCAVGLAWLPGRDLDRAFMVMGYMFCLSAAFALAKFIRDNAERPVDTPLWRLVVWGGFFLAMALDRLGPGPDGDQPGVSRLPRRQLAVPDLDLLHPRQDAARCAREPARGDRADARHRCAPRASAAEIACIRSIITEGDSHESAPPIAQTFATALRRGAIAVAASLALVGHAGAQSTISEASALSALPIAVSVAAPVMILSAGATLVVVAVEATSTGTVWVLERASDGARASVCLVGQGVAGASLAVGTVVVATALSTGWVLSAAGQAIAFVPNEIGRALLYNERITR